MQILQKLSNTANFGGNRSEIEYIVIHYTANRGDTAENNAVYFAREDVGASAHYFVDENEIWQSVLDSKIAWHCGANTYKHGYCRNTNSIGVEICMNDKNGAVRENSIAHAVVLVRWLMEKYHVPIQNVIRHYDVTGKNCPAPMVQYPNIWADFKSKLMQQEGEEEQVKYYETIQEVPTWAKAMIQAQIDKGCYADVNALHLSDDMIRTMAILQRAEE